MAPHVLFRDKFEFKLLCGLSLVVVDRRLGYRIVQGRGSRGHSSIYYAKHISGVTQAIPCCAVRTILLGQPLWVQVDLLVHSLFCS